MAIKCGECLFFEGNGKRCNAGRTPTASQSATSNCFKGPASLFASKVCGGCRFFEGNGKRCNAGRTPTSSTSATSNCYSPIPG